MEAAKAAAKAIVDRQPPGVVIGVVAFCDAGLSVLSADLASRRPSSRRSTGSGRHGAPRVGQGILAALEAIKQAESRHAGQLLQQPLAGADGDAGAGPRRAATRDAAIVLLQRRREQRAAGPGRCRPGRRRTRASGSYTVGVGTTAGTTLDLDGFKVQTALDESLLQQISDLTKGTYDAGRRAPIPGRSTPGWRSGSCRATRRSRSRRWSPARA